MVEREESAASMVENAIQHDANSTFMCGIEQGFEGFVSAKQGIDLVVIVSVVAVVGRGLEYRVEVNRGDAEVFQIIQLLINAHQIPAFVAVDGGGGVPFFEKTRFVHSRTPGKPVGEDLVKDGVLHPIRGFDVVVCHSSSI